MRRTPEAADAFLCVQEEIIRFGSPPPEEAPGRHRKRLSDTSTALANAAKKDEKTTSFLESPLERREDQSIINRQYVAFLFFVFCLFFLFLFWIPLMCA